jgi:propanediol dehydratase small subunit
MTEVQNKKTTAASKPMNRRDSVGDMGLRSLGMKKPEKVKTANNKSATPVATPAAADAEAGGLSQLSWAAAAVRPLSNRIT